MDKSKSSQKGDKPFPKRKFIAVVRRHNGDTFELTHWSAKKLVLKSLLLIFQEIDGYIEEILVEKPNFVIVGSKKIFIGTRREVYKRSYDLIHDDDLWLEARRNFKKWLDDF